MTWFIRKKVYNQYIYISYNVICNIIMYYVNPDDALLKQGQKESKTLEIQNKDMQTNFSLTFKKKIGIC